MQGLDLTREYAARVALPELRRGLGDDALSRIAVGSVGDGSDRFGFDDDVSRDHDWGVSLCVWTCEGEQALAASADQILRALPSNYCGYPILGFHVPVPEGRAGAWTVATHYAYFTGYAEGPRTLAEWARTPEHALAAATNGDVFYDGPGDFSRIRKRLLSGYPEPVRLQRIAQRCMDFAQAGQYNLVRAAIRGDGVGCCLAYARAVEAACLLVHELSHRYCPYYKWALTSCERRCGELGRAVAGHLRTAGSFTGALGACNARALQNELDDAGALIASELARQELTDDTSVFLLDHVNTIRTLGTAAGMAPCAMPRD